MASADRPFKEYNINGIANIGEKLYLNEDTADFHFLIESDDDQYERIPAHKLLLATASDVFRTMLNGSWLEEDEPNIVDASPSAFKEFLQFIYLGRARITAENVAQVMNMGKKYEIPECLNACRNLLISTLTNETTCMGYQLAILLDDEELKDFCENKIKHNMKEILSSSSFLACDPKVLRRILQLDTMFCTGAELVDACMSWLKSASKEEHLTRELIREHLGDMFYEIPFGSMSLEEFAVLDRSYKDLFTLAEYREIIQVMTSEDFEPKIFTAKRRTSPKWIEEAVVICDRRIADTNVAYYIKNIETTSFSVSKPILLGAMNCAPLYDRSNNTWNSPQTLPMKIMIIETNESSTLERAAVVYNCNADLEQFTRILLSNPIVIKPGCIYKIQMEQNPPRNYCTSVELKSKVEIISGIDSIQVKFHGSTDEDEVKKGLIWKLEFNQI